ncbi:Conserved oligomeric Golgi complex subunit 8 [Toxocara canis]|uniref:Conserved oligomeric Golgi complex subunit 8 n=1 Tax=Toxocara canis TaxID=6265 RepID=A0A0B2V3F7_TOXCA|nr:Conserved oligomeric Golgi complex subunit 8 [Toxocara canis]
MEFNLLNDGRHLSDDYAKSEQFASFFTYLELLAIRKLHYGIVTASKTAVQVVADKLIDARHYLLDELFNRFAGPIDLASSIQVVNSIRKIPHLSATQLRVSILQYRDLYLEKQIMDIRTQSDFILRMVEVYRDCMYDTMVLYLAVFPEGEIIKRDSSVDPRWDVWQSCGPSAVLSEWALHNLDVMFDYIKKVEDKSSVDVGVLSSKLMSFAMSFGRMGLDFRPLIANVLNDFVVSRFAFRVSNAASKFSQSESLQIEGDVPETVSVAQYTPGVQPPPPPVLSVWDDLCVYGNEILDAMNELRNGLSPTLIDRVLEALTASLKDVFTWLDRFAERAHQQENRCALRVADLYAHCAHSAKMEEIAKPVEQMEKAHTKILSTQSKRSEVVSEVRGIEKEHVVPEGQDDRTYITDNGESGEQSQSEVQLADEHNPDAHDSAVSNETDEEVDFTVPARVHHSEDNFSEVTLKDDSEM